MTWRIRTLVACALALAARGPAAADSVEIGFIATFSGPTGLIGQHMLDGFLLGVEHSGGKLGGLTAEVIASGKVRFAGRDMAFTNHSDACATDCPMKW